jgi:hypothetical protein
MVQSRWPRAGVRLPTAEVSASPTDQLHSSLAAVGPRRPNAAGYVDQVLTGVWFRVEGCDNGSCGFAVDSRQMERLEPVVPRTWACWFASSTMTLQEQDERRGPREHAANMGGNSAGCVSGHAETQAKRPTHMFWDQHRALRWHRKTRQEGSNAEWGFQDCGDQAGDVSEGWK